MPVMADGSSIFCHVIPSSLVKNNSSSVVANRMPAGRIASRAVMFPLNVRFNWTQALPRGSERKICLEPAANVHGDHFGEQ